MGETGILVVVLTVLCSIMVFSWAFGGFIRGSRTFDYAALVAVLSAVQPFIPQLALSKEWIPVAGMIVAAGIAFFRLKTGGPIK
jgi:hypothetical protein